MNTTLGAPIDEEVRRHFEAGWLHGQPEVIERCLPSPAHPCYLGTLVELVLIEMEMMWKSRGQPARAAVNDRPLPHVEEYVRRFPRLRDPACLLLLLKQEYSVRRRHGGQPSLTEFQARFPELVLSGEDMEFTLTSLSAPEPDLPQIPGYEILCRLGRGAMGVVFKARQLNLNRLVALKRILAGIDASVEHLARFHTEAEVLAQLHHPHIVSIYEIGVHEGLPYLALEFVPGCSLAQYLSGRPQPPKQAAGLVERLARAVQAAHERGILHRDLKPGNVLLRCQEGPPPQEETLIDTGAGSWPELDWCVPKITDFGLAKRLDQTSAQTQSGVILGTPSYMAPEQAGGKAHLTGPAADVYALGAILYELLTGRPPFRGQTVMDTVQQVLSDEPVPPTRLQPRTPVDLDTICLKCLNKDPGRRYASAAALAEDLRRFCAGEAILARPVSRAMRAAKWARRNPAVAGLTVAVGLALVLGTTIASWFAVRARASADLARQEALRADDKAKLALAEADRADREKRRAQQLALREAEAKQAALDAAKAREEQWNRAESLLYAHQISAAQREWEVGDARLAWHHWQACRPDLRDWEHRYLANLFNSNQTTLRGHNGYVASVAFSPDGTMLVSAGMDFTVRVWDAPEAGFVPPAGQKGRALFGHRNLVTSARFSPDGKRIASASYDGIVKFWDVDSGKEILSFKGNAGAITSLAFRPDGKRLASASSDKTIKVWDADNGKEVLTCTGHAQQVTSVVFSPDGKFLASGSNDHTVKVWDAGTAKEILNLKGHTDIVLAVAFSLDGKRLASGGRDRLVKVWDADKGRSTHSFRGHAKDVTGVAFGHDGSRLVSVSRDGLIKVWSLDRDSDPVTLQGHTGPVLSVAVSGTGQRIATGGDDTTVKVWALGRGQEVPTFTGHASVMAVAVSHNGDRIASAGYDQVVKVWDATERGIATPGGLVLHTLRGHTATVYGVAFSPDGKLICSGSQDTTAKVWDAEKGKLVHNLKGHSAQIEGVAFSPDGRRVATASHDKTVKVWDVQTGQEIRTLKGHKNFAVAVAFSPDGKRLASGSFDNTAKVWDAEDGRELLTFTGHASWVVGLAFSPDGKRIVSGSGKSLKVWDARTGQEYLHLDGHTGNVTCVAFCGAGKRIVSGAWDNTLKVWDAQRGQEVLTLKGHTAVPTCVVFSPDGRRIVSAAHDNTFKVWDAGPDQGH